MQEPQLLLRFYVLVQRENSSICFLGSYVCLTEEHMTCFFVVRELLLLLVLVVMVVVVVVVMVMAVVVVVAIWYFLAPAEEHMTLRSALCRSRCDGGGGGGGGERPQQLIKPKSLSVSQTIASCQRLLLLAFLLDDV